MSANQVEPPRKRGRPRNVEPSAEYRERLTDIVTVAAKVFHAKGYEAGSLDDVAAALGMRKASLYYYVKRKSDLLRLVFERAITVALSEVDRLAEIDDPEERLAALIRYQATLVASDPPLFAVFFGQRSGLEDADLADISRKERRYIRRFVLAVEAAMEADVLPPGDARVMANMIVGMTSWSYKWFDPRRDAIDTFADSCVELVIRHV
ncbi:TetR/AcrR family transcriptional regulator [Acidiferrimicrobium sp. IK]|uniref:TetR/AcrR family transcriptional regulator n=1 Tax=Acidiferrimicrobium sp. IK TaxID=2871700 RepID=UPI0021CB0468|nr:TetR/AcrR family transcriptional regulator [Acidiferrimicrobium sp. IK]MCU4186652.1 TetR/AcrR family transcriptional regulator [Acidiferrimicrobium sp. IK]